MNETLTGKRREILDFIAAQVRERGYPPSVREIGVAVGLASTSTVQAHLNTLQRQGYLRRDPTKPRALEVRYDSTSGAAIERRPTRHVPLVGDIAAGTNVLASENIEELLPLPEDFTGGGNVFMLRVRGDSMIDAGILDGDYVVVRQQPDANTGDVVAAGIPGGEATVKTYSGAATASSCCLPTRTGSPWSFPPTKSPSSGRWSPSCAASDPGEPVLFGLRPRSRGLGYAAGSSLEASPGKGGRQRSSSTPPVTPTAPAANGTTNVLPRLTGTVHPSPSREP